MKAIIQTGYGLPAEVLELREVEKPAPAADQVLIKVTASSITFGDLASVGIICQVCKIRQRF